MIFVAGALAAAPAVVGGSLTGLGTGLVASGPVLVGVSLALPRTDRTFQARDWTLSAGGLAIGVGAVMVALSPLERAHAMSDVGYEVSDRAGRLAVVGLGVGLLLGAAATTAGFVADDPRIWIVGDGLAAGIVAASVASGWVQGARNARALATQSPQLQVRVGPTGLELTGRF